MDQVTEIAGAIKQFFKGEVDTSEKTLETYSSDSSLFKIRPQVVVFPKDSEDVKSLVKWVSENKAKYPDLSLTARAAGTCMSGGPINTSIIVDTNRHMNKIVSIEQTEKRTMLPMFPGAKEVELSGIAVVEPGCFYRDFEKATLQKNLLLPCYTASKSINAVGGMVGNNSAGELTLRYGKTEDYLKEVSIVLEDGNEYVVKALNRSELESKIAGRGFEGELYKKIAELIEKNKEIIKNAKPQVSKNSAGYTIWNVWNNAHGEEVFDLPKLIVGSQGTFGIVTKITFDLIQPSKKSKLLVIFLKKLDHLGEVVKELAELKPESIESYDDKTFGLAVRFFFDFLKAKGVWGSIKFGLSFIPEFFLTLTGGVPKLILLVEFAGDSDAEIHRRCLKAQKQIAHFRLGTHITRSIAEADKYWAMRRDSFALLRNHAGGRRTAPFIDDIIVPPQFLPEFMPKLDKILEKYPNLIYTIAGHAGNGNFHIIPLMKLDDPYSTSTILELSDKVYDLVLSYKGSIDAEHNDGIIRTPYLVKMYGPEVIEIFQQIKNIFDPKNIFNPGKKVGGTKENIEKYLQPSGHPIKHHAS